MTAGVVHLLLTLAGSPSVPRPGPSAAVPLGSTRGAADRDQHADAAGRREHRPVRGPVEAHRRRHAAGLPGFIGTSPAGTRPGGHPAVAAGDRLPLPARAGQLAAAALTRWDVDLRAAPPGRECPRPPARSSGGRDRDDLASAPARERPAWRRPGGRVWVNPGRAPSTSRSCCPAAAPITPARRWRSCRLRPRRGPRPLTVQLPPPAWTPPPAHRRLRRTVGLPRRRGHRWRTSAGQRAPGMATTARTLHAPEIGPCAWSSRSPTMYQTRLCRRRLLRLAPPGRSRARCPPGCRDKNRRLITWRVLSAPAPTWPRSRPGR